jgi:hypothetical protein
VDAENTQLLSITRHLLLWKGRITLFHKFRVLAVPAHIRAWLGQNKTDNGTTIMFTCNTRKFEHAEQRRAHVEEHTYQIHSGTMQKVHVSILPRKHTRGVSSRP